MKLDQRAYDAALATARLAIHFTDRLHPRDFHGRFRDTPGGMAPAPSSWPKGAIFKKGEEVWDREKIEQHARDEAEGKLYTPPVGMVQEARTTANGAIEYLVSWGDTKTENWERDFSLMNTKQAKVIIKAAAQHDIETLPPGTLIRSGKKGKRFKIHKHGNWTSVHPVDEYGEVIGKHTVLPPGTKVEKIKAAERPKVQPPKPQTAPGGVIPRHMDLHVAKDGTKTYIFTFPDGTKDVRRIDPNPAYSDFANIARTAIAYQRDDGSYGVYWTTMYEGTEGLDKKVKELTIEHPNGVYVYPVISSVNKYTKREPMDWDPKSVKAEWGENLFVDEPNSIDVEQALEDIEYIPREMVRRLRAQRVRVHVGNRTVPDLDDNLILRNVQPRGYPPGSTWSQSGGAYSPMDRFAVAGTRRYSGSRSTVLHEIGHAVGHTLNVDTDEDLRKHHRRLHPKLGPYFQQDGPGGSAGRQELWAESFAEYLLSDKGTIARKYDQEYADWMEEKVADLSGRGKLPELNDKKIKQMKSWAFNQENPVAYKQALDKTRNHNPHTGEEWLLALVAEYMQITNQPPSTDALAQWKILTHNVMNMYV